MTTPDEQWIPHKPKTWPQRYGTLKRPVEMAAWNGNHPTDDEANWKRYTLPRGTVVKIVMVSRFGDVGITEHLERENGYDARVSLEDLNLRDKP